MEFSVQWRGYSKVQVTAHIQELMQKIRELEAHNRSQTAELQKTQYLCKELENELMVQKKIMQTVVQSREELRAKVSILENLNKG